LGIIESKSIWATNALYLNDASELNYSRKMFKTQLREYQNNIIKNINSYEYNVFTTLIMNIEDKDFIHPDLPGIYVSSFSEKDDLLSQWRGYCPRGPGFSLGFKLTKLKKCFLEGGAILIRQCIYDEKQQIKRLIKLIDQFVQKYNDDIEGGFEYFFNEFMKLAPTLKHPKFQEEREWRIFYIPSVSAVHNVEFRGGQTMAIPYIEIPLPREKNELLINRIVIGPTPEHILSKTSLKMILNRKHVRFNDVQCSSIPYRNW